MKRKGFWCAIAALAFIGTGSLMTSSEVSAQGSEYNTNPNLRTGNSICIGVSGLEEEYLFDGGWLTADVRTTASFDASILTKVPFGDGPYYIGATVNDRDGNKWLKIQTSKGWGWLNGGSAEGGCFVQGSGTRAINDLTNQFFYAVRPNMRGRRIQANQTLYRREWEAINQVVQANARTSRSSNGRITFTSFNAPRSKLADAVFFARHPERSGQGISPNEANLAQEWRSIHSRFK